MISIYITGVIGVLLVPFFSMANGGKYGESQGGIVFYGGCSYAWTRFLINLVGVLSIAAWSVTWSFLIFGCLKMAKLLRIDEETEFFGIDVAKHGEASYPMDAWVSSLKTLAGNKRTSDKVPFHISEPYADPHSI